MLGESNVFHVMTSTGSTVTIPSTGVRRSNVTPVTLVVVTGNRRYGTPDVLPDALPKEGFLIPGPSAGLLSPRVSPHLSSPNFASSHLTLPHLASPHRVLHSPASANPRERIALVRRLRGSRVAGLQIEYDRAIR